MNTKSLYRSASGEKAVMQFYDKVLAAWPVPHETLTVPTRYGDTFIIASGNKADPPLLLLHGACSNALSWFGDMPEYSRYFRTYAVDIPGEPGKSAPVRPAWNSPAYAAWLEDVLNGLQIPRVSLIGLSQGGWTALKFAVHHPERVTKLVLLTPAGVVPDKASFLWRAVFFSMLGRKGAERLNRIVFGKNHIDGEAMAFMNLIMTHFKPRIGRLAMFTNNELKRLTMPVLLLGGAQDAVRNAAKISARLTKLHPDVTTAIIPDRGHVLINVTGEVIPFLKAK
jgi:pimeloyl-ACP methyl ester carboxylesterase